jgi:hypothetical protein
MPTYNYQIKIVKSLGGRTNALSASNTYNVQSTSSLINGDFDALIDHIVEAEKLAAYNVVHFLRGTVKPLVQTPTERLQRGYISRELEGTGSRVLGAKKLMPENVCLGVKRVAKLQRSGTMYYRWCLAQEDVTSGADNSFVLLNPAAFRGGGAVTDTLVQLLNEVLPEGQFIMPNKPLDAFDVNRLVDAHVLSGVLFRQANNVRSSTDAAFAKGAERKIRELEKSILEVLRGLIFSALDPGAQAVVLRAVTQIREILLSLPPKQAMKIALNEALRALPGGPSL